AGGVPPTPTRESRRAAGPGGGLPEGDGPEAGGPLRHGDGTGRGRGTLAGRRAGPRLPGAVDGAPGPVAEAAPNSGDGRRRFAGPGGGGAGGRPVGRQPRKEPHGAGPHRGSRGAEADPSGPRRDVVPGDRRLAVPTKVPRADSPGVPREGPEVVRR